MNDNYKEEKGVTRKRKRRKKKRYLLKLCVVLLLCAAVYGLLHSSLFTVEELKVSKTVHFTEAQIKDMAGIQTGMNLFDFRAGKIQDKLEADPHIKKAKVSRVLPKTVTIKVWERIETAVIPADKKFIVMDQEGMVLSVVDKAPKLTRIKGLKVTRAVEGEAIQVKENAALKRAVDILIAMQKSNLYFKKIDVSNRIVKAYITDQLFCKGTAKNLTYGVGTKDLQAVLNNLKAESIKRGAIIIGENQYYSFSPKIK